MLNIFRFLCFIATLSCATAEAEVTQTASLQPVIDAIQKSDENTLIVLDVDDVLVKADDQILQLAHKKELDKIIADLAQKHPRGKIEDLTSLVFLQYQKSLVDPNIKEIFELLKDKDIKFIALTAAPTGKLGQIQSLEDWRIEDLKKFGFDFSHSFPEILPTTFTNLPSLKNPKQFCAYKEGILFTCDVPKGEVLKAFLSLTKHQFKKIIFVDDLRKNLDSVEKVCAELGIAYHGFEYTAVQASTTPLNKERIQVQINTLLEKGKWLTDTEAEKLL